MATIFIDPGLGSGTDAGTSWTNAYQDLQNGVDQAGAGDECWVKGRTVTLTARIDLDNTNAPNIYGGFAVSLTGTDGSVGGRTLPANATILDGDATYACSQVTKSCTIDGIRFQNGAGGGATGININTAGVTVVVSNCSFWDNAGSFQGGAIYVVSTATETTFDTCVFDGNTGASHGSAIYNAGATCTIVDCTFNENVANNTGASIRTDGSTTTVTDCVFTANDIITGTYGSGSCCHFASPTSITLTRCLFDTNTSATNQWGVVQVYNATAASIVNCIFVGNSTTRGGGLCIYNGVATITNCTVADNTCVSAGLGGGLYNLGATTDIANCIFWGNTANAVANQIQVASGTLTATYSDVEGTFTGTGNVDDDPNFITTGDDPYNLNTTSGAVDSANAGATDYPTTDYLGQSRVDHTGVGNTGAGSPAYTDMGAYELQEAAPAPAATTKMMLLLTQ